MDELLELLSTISSKSLSQSYVLAQTGSIKKKQVNLALFLNIFCRITGFMVGPPFLRHSRDFNLYSLVVAHRALTLFS